VRNLLLGERRENTCCDDLDRCNHVRTGFGWVWMGLNDEFCSFALAWVAIVVLLEFCMG
jgi:hypothetical protein